MSGDDAIDLVNSVGETQDASSDQTRQRIVRQCTVLGTLRTTEYRDRTHRGAWCNACLRNGVSKDPKGHFFANIEQVLGKTVPTVAKAVGPWLQLNSKLVREKIQEKGAVAGLKRSASSVSAGSSAAGDSCGSNTKNKTLAAFLPLADTGLSETEQAEWELQLLLCGAHKFSFLQVLSEARFGKRSAMRVE